MPRDGAIIFSDLIGQLDALRVSCEKCGRDGRVSSISVAGFVTCAHVRFGSKADITFRPDDVRFASKADIEAMQIDVRFVPIADN